MSTRGRPDWQGGPSYKDLPVMPPPYDWEQAGEVARLVTAVMEEMIKVWTDRTEAHEREWPMEKIRVAQGVGICLEAMLHTFRTYTHSYGRDCDEAAQTQAHHYLEDF